MAKKDTTPLHERLDITFAEYGALLAVREMLKAGVLLHRPTKYTPAAHVFNMGISCTTNDHCGSVGCIGGTMGLVMGLDAGDAAQFVYSASNNTRLRRLFFPNMSSARYRHITPKNAVRAINNFLNPKIANPWEGIKLKNAR